MALIQRIHSGGRSLAGLHALGGDRYFAQQQRGLLGGGPRGSASESDGRARAGVANLGSSLSRPRERVIELARQPPGRLADCPPQSVVSSEPADQVKHHHDTAHVCLGVSDGALVFDREQRCYLGGLGQRGMFVSGDESKRVRQVRMFDGFEQIPERTGRGDRQQKVAPAPAIGPGGEDARGDGDDVEVELTFEGGQPGGIGRIP